MSSSVETAGGIKALDASLPDLPDISLPQAPAAGLLWRRGLTVAGILMTLFTLDVVTVIFGDYWLFESLGLTKIFWTNFAMGAQLYVAAFLAFAAAIAVPAYTHQVSPRMRRAFKQAALLIASVAAYLAANNYSEFLLGGRGFVFDSKDPVFNLDIGFYAFDLPNVWIAWKYLIWGAFAFLASSVACANSARSRIPAALPPSRLRARVALSATPTTRLAWLFLGIARGLRRLADAVRPAAQEQLGRRHDQAGRPVPRCDGILFQPQLHLANVLRRARRHGRGFPPAARDARSCLFPRARESPARRPHRDLAGRARLRLQVRRGGPLLAFRETQRAGHPAALHRAPRRRHAARVQPRRRAGGRLPAEPSGRSGSHRGKPALAARRSRTLRCGPGSPATWSGGSTGSTRSASCRRRAARWSTGPRLELFQQQQKLRTYYNFINVDSVRYTVGGQKKMFVSAVRETPLYEPVPWLAYWGQRFMMFTHGFGLGGRAGRRAHAETAGPRTCRGTSPRRSNFRSSPPPSRASTTAKAPRRWPSPTSTG